MKRERNTIQLLNNSIRVLIFAIIPLLPATAKQVMLYGSGNSWIDTPALQNAVNNLPAGDTLHLVGHFKIGETINAGGFDGIIKGDGKYETIIEAAGYTLESHFQKVFIGNGILNFSRSNSTAVTIKDLSLVYSAWVLLNLSDSFTLVSMYNPVHDANTTIKSVFLYSTDPVIDYGIALWRESSSGKTSIVDCEIAGMELGIFAEGPDSGTFNLTGNMISEVSVGINVKRIHNGTLNIKDNQIADVGRAIHLGEIRGDSSMKNNAFHGEIVQCIVLWNSSETQIKNNRIENVVCPSPNKAGITLNSSSDCIVEGNSFLHTTGFTGGIIGNSSSADNSIIANHFVDTRFRRHAISIKGVRTTLLDNDFYASGIPGDGIGPDRCITLGNGSSQVYVQQPLSLLPFVNPDPVTQVKDSAPSGVNTVVFY